MKPYSEKPGCCDSKKSTRNRIEPLRNRLFLLTGQNKVIMSLYLENRISYRQIALLLGISPSSILRRIKKIANAMELYVLCLKNREQFTFEELSIAEDYFLKMLSIRQIAIRKKKSFYYMREKIEEIQQITNTF